MLAKMMLLSITLFTTSAAASPAACRKGPKDMVRDADRIYVAKPVAAKAVRTPGTKVHSAEYTVSTVIRGPKVRRVVLVADCRDEAIPERQLGYPGAQLYCPNHLDLPGFTFGVKKPTDPGDTLLFITASGHPVGRTGYGDCDDTQWPSTLADTTRLITRLAKLPTTNP